MALRGTPARLGRNPLAGVLRDLDKRARSNQRVTSSQGRRLSAEVAEVAEMARAPAPPPPKPAPPPPPRTVFATVAATNDEGRATWVFPQPFPALPVVTATPVDPVAGDIFAVTVNLESVTAEQVTARVWQTLTPVVPVGAGLLVHMMAVPPD